MTLQRNMHQDAERVDLARDAHNSANLIAGSGERILVSSGRLSGHRAEIEDKQGVIYSAEDLEDFDREVKKTIIEALRKIDDIPSILVGGNVQITVGGVPVDQI